MTAREEAEVDAADGQHVPGGPPAPRLEVRRGRPDDVEVAAVALALAATATARDEARAESTPRWLRAARLEGLGSRPIAAPHELDTDPQ